LQIQAPEGTTSITLTMDYEAEDGYDFVVIKDVDGNLIAQDGSRYRFGDDYTAEGLTGSATAYQVTVPGSYVMIGIDSDGSGVRVGYTITAIEVQ
ncbi:MAG: hypothetical protein CMH49_04805, partial [Myxococcales bacterium]|nr:hypothetical protein [Myxococcales bacterium]